MIEWKTLFYFIVIFIFVGISFYLHSKSLKNNYENPIPKLPYEEE